MKRTREEAWKLLTEYVSSESLRKHCRAVEASMRAMAEKFEGDVEEWGITGLLHDFDYEKYSNIEEHAVRGAEILRERHFPEWIVRAVLSHNDASGIPRETMMERSLAAVDELSGFVVACAYVRPTRFEGMTAESVEKNLKKKGFAEKVDREEIRKGIEALEMDRRECIELVVHALQGIAKELGF